MERGISSARDFVIEPLAKAILVAQLAAALGATWSSPSRRLTPSAVACCLWLLAPDWASTAVTNPTVRPTANEIVLSTLIRPGEAGSNCWWQKIAMNKRHAAFLSRLDLLSNTKGAW